MKGSGDKPLPFLQAIGSVMAWTIGMLLDDQHAKVRRLSNPFLRMSCDAGARSASQAIWDGDLYPLPTQP
jgi:hypothetical protein